MAALKRLNACLRRYDPGNTWARYHGAVPYADLHRIYAHADLGVFASSCENMPNILFETMAAGLPVACAHRGPMPEILQGTGVNFDSEEPEDIAGALKQLLASPQVRTDMANISYAAAQAYTWERFSSDTFGFLARIARHYPKHDASGSVGKWVLKKAMEPYLPREVIYRPKSGFGAPLRCRMRFELRELLGDMLSEASYANGGCLNRLLCSA